MKNSPCCRWFAGCIALLTLGRPSATAADDVPPQKAEMAGRPGAKALNIGEPEVPEELVQRSLAAQEPVEFDDPSMPEAQVTKIEICEGERRLLFRE